jgi:hypothetical protein
MVSWFLAFGWVPLQYESVAYSNIELNSKYVATVAQIGLEATISERFHVFGDVENFQYFNKEDPQTGGAFKPYRVDYSFGASFYFNKWISIEARHECDHIVKNAMSRQGYESSETKVIVKITGVSSF